MGATCSMAEAVVRQREEGGGGAGGGRLLPCSALGPTWPWLRPPSAVPICFWRAGWSRQVGCERAPKPGEDPGEEQGADIRGDLGWEGDSPMNVGRLQDAGCCSH